MSDDFTDRLLPLEGGINFRDMGGYPAADGRTVKWRHLFRSGTMARLTPADRDHLAGHGIRTVIDFRTATEQAAEPNAWAQEGDIAYWARPHEETFGNLHEMVDRGISSPEEAHAIMVGGFRHLPFQQAEAFAEMMRRLAGGEVPLAFHCTAGKDRTGGAAALVLASLGVPRDAIIADFVLTERTLDLEKAFRNRRDDPNSARYRNVDMTVMAPLGAAHPDYVTAFLDVLDERCGSVENYLSDLGISASDLSSIRENLLD